MPDYRQLTDTDAWKEGDMRSRLLAVIWLLVGVLGVGTIATSGDGIAPRRQWAVVYLVEPTLIGSTIVQGPVLFTHDDSKMARGEPCTTVRLVGPTVGPTEEIAAFDCVPVRRNEVYKFTLRTRPNTEMGVGCVLMEYQFVGDTEGHGVPSATNAH